MKFFFENLYYYEIEKKLKKRTRFDEKETRYKLK